MEFQVLSNQGADIATIKIMYKFFCKAIIASDGFFEKFVDRREFLNKMILNPLTDIAESLKNPGSDSQVETLKKARTLLIIILTWIKKTALVRNGYVFTLNILDNECLVMLI